MNHQAKRFSLLKKIMILCNMTSRIMLLLTKFVFWATFRDGPALLTAPHEKIPGNLSRRVRPNSNLARIPKISPKNMIMAA